MKYTIHGFQQDKLIELGLNNDDALILSVIKDMYSSASIEFQIIDGERYIWVNQSNLIFEQIPIIGHRASFMRKIKRLEEKEIIVKRTLFEKFNKKENKFVKGTFSFIKVTEKLDYLMEYDLVAKCDTLCSKMQHTPVAKCDNKDSSIKDSNSIIYSRIIEYLNSKTGKSYKSTTRKTQSLIKARIDEGFNEEEFFKVIDSKVSEWKGTEYEKYLRPETLFGNKFEGYLNQELGAGTKEISKDNLNIKKGNFDY
ncbi:conserved phage C-terminal domain-containing protein [Clostridium perfringens]|nr:conserved phage C-terminal domain-containing protein [Clostridium perfringens]MDU4131342.1 conserved phage C-terminal domain-containing protein [Clostridium perfringens]